MLGRVLDSFEVACLNLLHSRNGRGNYKLDYGTSVCVNSYSVYLNTM